MKLVRWTLAGASFYVIYKYAIGKKAKGEEVFASPDNDGAQPENNVNNQAEEVKKPAAKPKKSPAKPKGD